MTAAGQTRWSSLALALLAATMLTPPDRAEAAPGDAVGGEFQVNSFTEDVQGGAALAMDADGDFVVTWSSYGQDGDGYGVFAQRYDAAGSPLGGEFQVNETTVGNQFDASIAMGSNGFTVAWQSDDGAGTNTLIWAREYGLDGVARTGEIQVNTTELGPQIDPQVARSPSGYTVVWNGNGDNLDQGTFLQRYDSGIDFSVGDGGSDATMTFRGTVADVNAALDGLVGDQRHHHRARGADQLDLGAADLTDAGQVERVHLRTSTDRRWGSRPAARAGNPTSRLSPARAVLGSRRRERPSCGC